MDVDSPGGGWKRAATPTPTPAASTSTGAPAGPVYWGGLTEAQLAALQRKQGDLRNDCADYSSRRC